MLVLVGAALEIVRVIFLIHPVQGAQDILCNSGLTAEVAVRRVTRMIILDASGTNVLPGNFFVSFRWGR
jgi:hypothetical protein